MNERQKEGVELLDEYDFSKAAIGKYAKQGGKVTKIVILEADVAQVFPDSATVSQALRQFVAPQSRAKTMKKTLARKKEAVDEETMHSEYRFDYSKSQPNRFAAKMSKGSVAVVLEPDVAKIFRSSEVVNELLRSIIAAMSLGKQARRTNRTT